MAGLAYWFLTDLPEDIIKNLDTDLKKYDLYLEPSKTIAEVENKPPTVNFRNSKSCWVPTSHWISGWIWYYINKANRENFLYDITEFDNGHIQYTQYDEGQFYNWHSDADIDMFYQPKSIPGTHVNIQEDQTYISGEYVRKLSFVLQLSSPDDYTGGELQFLSNKNKTFFGPKTQGTLLVFDSRVKHRVRKVRSGSRKSLVGWVVGPRWK